MSDWVLSISANGVYCISSRDTGQQLVRGHISATSEQMKLALKLVNDLFEKKPRPENNA
jgi:hypothetical protein